MLDYIFSRILINDDKKNGDIMKKVIKTIVKGAEKSIKDGILDKKASPLIEEGLLIGLALIIFLIILAIVSDILTWINELYTEVSNNEVLIYALQ